MSKFLKSIMPVTAERRSNGHLYVGGHDLAVLAAKWGTPLYIYDSTTIHQQVQTLKDVLTNCYAGKYEITYACKAYFSLGFARRVKELDLGLDVVSLGEARLALRGGILPDRLHLHGNNKSEEEIRLALANDFQAIVLDSMDELELVEQIASQMNKRARVWIRVTPGFEVDTHPYRQTSHPTSKFGFLLQDGEAAAAIRRAMASDWLHLTGLHTHIGSQIFEVQPFMTAVDVLMKLAAQEGFVPEEISPGGGWGVPYLPSDAHNGAAEWLQAVCSRVKQQCERRNWPLPKLILEPGRLIVARAGMVVYTVGNSKTVADGSYVISIDGGMADNPRPALYESKYTACLVNRVEGPYDRLTRLVGKFCESGDMIIGEARLPEMHRGDLVAVPVAGAYQLSMSSNYNLAPRPAVLWLEPHKVTVLQNREEPDRGGWWVSGEG